MPVQSWGHTQYWNRDDGVAAPVTQTRGGYPLWQASVIIGSLFGVLQPYYERLVWWWGWAVRLWHLADTERIAVERILAIRESTVDRKAVIDRVSTLIVSERYAHARGAVKTTAMTLEMNKPHVWAQIGAELRGDLRGAENFWRHVHASRLLAQADETLTNPDKHLLVELAYTGYAASPRTP